MYRVLHIISGLGAGGAQRVLARLIAATADVWTHEIISLADAGDPRHEFCADVVVHGLEITGFVDALRSVERVRCIARQFRPTVIQGWMYHGNLVALQYGFIARKSAPIVWNVRHSSDGRHYHGYATRLVIRANVLLSRYANAVIFNSAQSLRVHEQMGFSTERSYVIPNGFDTLKFAPCDDLRERWRRTKGIPSRAFVFGHAARLHPVKNHAGALRAFAQIAAENRDVWMVMVGEGVQESASELQEIACSPSCSGRVVLAGNELDMTAFYNGIDTLVLSSWSEAMPNVLGEAMACGTPCISTDVGDAAMLVDETGWIVAEPSEAELANTMKEACKLSQARIAEKGRAARERIVREFPLSGMINQYSRLYRAMSDASSNGRSGLLSEP